jgi:hypothetical protein
VINWQFAAYQPNCAACHADNYESGPHKKVDIPTIRYTVGELQDCSGACHVYTDASLTVIQEIRNNQHRVSDSAFN